MQEQISLPGMGSNEDIKNGKPNFDIFSTRYQGSKLKILNWIWHNIKDLPFDSCLDAFGGTGSVAYMFKYYGKAVDYNDNLKFNSIIGKATIENDNIKLSEDETEQILTRSPDKNYPTFIEDTFSDIFFLDEENKWLDFVTTNIYDLENEYKRAIAFTALFQACIIKRPYNLFHRANLYMRTADVKRNFGNKTTWDKPFPDYFRQFVNEINPKIISNGKLCRAFCEDVFNLPTGHDLVYIDTPYMNEKGTGVDYLDFYHFLEGLVDYRNWANRISNRYKHKRLIGEKSLWAQKKEIKGAFEKLFQKFRDSILVVSYRDDGIPKEDELKEMMEQYKQNVTVYHKDYQYALSHKNGQEILLIGT